MPRIRTIKPDFWKDYRMAEELTRDQRLLYVALWNEADDEGRFLAHPRRLLGAIFPYDRDLHESFIDDSLKALARTGRLVLYSVDGEPYAQLTKFADHQRINRPQPSRIPPPPTGYGDSLNAHGTLTEDSVPEVEGEEEEYREEEEVKQNLSNNPREAAKAEMQADVDARSEQVPEGRERAAFVADARGIVSGDNAVSWKDHTGASVPWEERPALLRLALDGMEAGKAKALHWSLVHVIRQQRDPLVPRTAAEIQGERPAPNSEAARVRSETPGASRSMTAGVSGFATPAELLKASVLNFEREKAKRDAQKEDAA